MATITTKALVAQSPVYTQDNDGKVAVTGYVDAAMYPFTTPEERQSVAPECKAAARRVGGRVIVRTTTVDDKDTPDELDDDISIAEKVINAREASVVSVTMERSQAFLLVSRLSGVGEPWADKLAAQVTAAMD